MTTYYVSVNGNNSNPGTQSRPFKNIQKGISTSTNGDTVHVLAGTYYQTMATRPVINKSISVIGSGRSNTIIDGTNITSEWESGWQGGLVEITASNVTFSGFTVQNALPNSANTTNPGYGPAGIIVYPVGTALQNITIENNYVYNTWASGIKVYGNSPSMLTTNFKIAYNELYSVVCGGDPSIARSESLSIVDSGSFEICYNYVHHTGYTPTGYIVTGGEGIDLGLNINTSITSSSVHHNYVYDTRSTGVYVDGGGTAQNVQIYQNITESIYAYYSGSLQRGGGFSIGPEQEGTNLNITWNNNISYNNGPGMFICNCYVSGGHNTNLIYNVNIFYANDIDISYSGSSNCMATLSGVLIENNYAETIDSFPAGVTLSGNITNPTQVVNAFNYTYASLKNDIISQATGGAGTTLASIQIYPATSHVNVSKTIQLSATCKGTNNNKVTCPTLTWSSSNKSLATVNSAGLVKGVAAGNVSIVASASGIISNMSAITVSSRHQKLQEQ